MTILLKNLNNPMKTQRVSKSYEHTIGAIFVIQKVVKKRREDLKKFEIFVWWVKNIEMKYKENIFWDCFFILNRANFFQKN